MPYKYKIVDRIIQLAGICFLVLQWVFTVLAINKSGDKVPSHFKLDGTVDGYSGKWVLWILPIIGTVIYFVMAVLVRILPRLLPYSVVLSEIKSEKRQSAISRILKLFQLLFIGQFACLSFSSFLVIINPARKVPDFVFPGFLAGALFLIILLVVQYLRSDK